MNLKAPTTLDGETINVFKKIIKKEEGIDITKEEALEYGLNLLNVIGKHYQSFVVTLKILLLNKIYL